MTGTTKRVAMCIGGYNATMPAARVAAYAA